MKRRIYLIVALALVNIAVMKYNEFKTESKLSARADTDMPIGAYTDSLR